MFKKLPKDETDKTVYSESSLSLNYHVVVQEKNDFSY